MTKSNPYELQLAGELIDGRYRVERLIGHGGMGTVWLAKDERVDGRAVVVKVPRASFLEQEGFLDRFEREIKSLTRLDHPRIVKVLDIAHVRAIPCVVLQFLGGGSLAERTETAVRPEDVVPWITPVAEALDFIHSQGVIHRDVKPGNILFDGYGNAFLADFGIAKALGGEETGLTQSGASPGSPSFMAPEAGAPDALGPRYDQYSLAVVIYKALSGRLPHEGRTALEVIMKRSVEPPLPLRQAAPAVSAAVERVVMKALSRAPTDRYVSCRAFAADFVSAVGTSLSVATPRSEFTRNVTSVLPTGKSGASVGAATRKRIVVAVAALLAVGGGIFGWKQLNRGDGGDPSHTGSGGPKESDAPVAAAKFAFELPAENAAIDLAEVEIAGAVTPAEAEKVVVGWEKGPVTTVEVGAGGAVRTKLAAPAVDGRAALVAWTLDRRELARRNVDIDRTPATVFGHPKETRPFVADEKSFTVLFDASEPVTLFDESGTAELARLAAGSRVEARLKLPEGATAQPQKRSVKLLARDHCAHETKISFEIELFDLELRAADVAARRPRAPAGFDALRGAALVTAATTFQGEADQWEREVVADGLLGSRRDELAKAADWLSLRTQVRTAADAAFKVKFLLESPADGSATSAGEVLLRGRVDPPGSTVQIGVAKLAAKEFVAGSDGLLEARVALPDKDGPCRIEVKSSGAGGGSSGALIAQVNLVVDRAVAVNKEPAYEPDVGRGPVDRDVFDHVTAKLDFGEAVTVTLLDPASGEPHAGAPGLAFATGKGDLPLPLPATNGAARARVTLAYRAEDALKNRKDYRRDFEITSGKVERASDSADNLKKIADWADVVREDADPAQIPEAKVRARIAASALPWLVRHRQTGIEMVLVPRGEYLMGSMANDQERPVHRVKLTRDFYVGRFEVTQGEWAKVVATNPSKFQGDAGLPVEQISYEELTRNGGFLDQTRLRLLTEGEWEYVAHGLNETRFPWGDNEDPTCANCAASVKDGRALEQTAKVGSYPKGISWCGAFDMVGNVWEWCSDWHDPLAYNSRVIPVVDPSGPGVSPRTTMRVIRGGAWNENSKDARCARRGKLAPGDRYSYVGFRVAKSP